MKLYQFAASPFCDKIRRIVRYKQLAFEIHEWPLAEAASIRDKNPIGKLPILESIACRSPIACR